MTLPELFLAILVLFFVLFLLTVMFSLNRHVVRTITRNLYGPRGPRGANSQVTGPTGSQGSEASPSGSSPSAPTGPPGGGGQGPTGAQGITGASGTGFTGPAGGGIGTGPTGSFFGPSIFVVTGTLSSTQIKNLPTTPVQILPGVPNQIIQFWRGMMYYKFGTTPYVVSDSDPYLLVSWTTDPLISSYSAAAFGPDVGGLLNAVTQNAVVSLQVSYAPEGGFSIDAVGKSLYFTLLQDHPDDTITGGDGTLDYNISYSYYTP